MIRRLCFAAIYSAVLLIPRLASAQVASTSDVVLADQRLPEQVYAYLSVPDVKRLVDQWNACLTGQLLADPALAGFRTEVTAAFDEKMEELSVKTREQLGLSMQELLEIPNGEITIAIAGAPPNKFGLVVLIDFGDRQERVDEILTRAEELLEEQGVDRSAEDVDGTQIVVHEKAPAEDNPTGRRGGKLAWFVRDSYLAVSNEPAVLEEIIARWDGDSEQSFASHEVYSYIVERCSEDSSSPQVVWFVNPMDLLRSALQSGAAGKASLQIGMMMGMLPTLGLDKVHGFGGTVDIATEDYDTVSRSVVYVDQPPSGVLKAFQFEQDTHSPPDWVTAGATGYFSMNWQIADAFESVGNLLDMFQGPGFFDQVIEKYATDEAGLQIHLKRDVVDQLAGRVQIFSDVRDETETGGDRTLFALSCRDEDAMRAIVDRLAETPGLPVEQREYRGGNLYEIPNPKGADSPMGVAVANGMLLFATDVTLLEQVLRGDKDQDKLVDARGYRRILANVPERTSILGFREQAIQLRPLYEAVRAGNGADVIPGSYDFFEKYDFSSLPPFAEIRKYLPPTGTFTIPDERGVYSESFTVRPEQ